VDEATIANHLKTDRRIGRNARGFAVSFLREDDRASVSTSIPTLIRHLLKHPEFDADTLTIVDGEKRRGIDPEAFDGDGHVVAVKGYVPIGCLKMKSIERSNDAPRLVVA
jgi:hypothetical protein